MDTAFTLRHATGDDTEAIALKSNVTQAESHAFCPTLDYKDAQTQRVYRKRLRSW